MIYFASQKYRFLPKLSPKAFLVFIAFVMLKLTLPAQESIDYRGVWQVNTPDAGALILIVKRNNLASYFWADNADRIVYQGKWNGDETGATLIWKDGSTHRIERDSLSYTVTHSDASQNLLYTTSAQQLPEELLGQWAKEPSRPDEQISDRDKAKGFFGTWEIGTESNAYYVIIESDRSAATNWTQEKLNPTGLRGSWAKQGSELHIAWDTGHYSILKQNERNYTFQLIAPGTLIESDEANELLAARADKDSVPVEWQTQYAEEKTAKTGGIAFTNRKDANQFYRGAWIIQREPDAFERIEIGRFGGLKTSVDPTLMGNWRMSGQDIFMNWDDGMRKVLSPVGKGFLLYEYKPGRPIDGVPTRVFSATPEDAGKFAKHMKDRKEVAEQLLSLAEDAGVTSSMTDNGWGQTFMRWAWPFGNENETAQPSDALLQASYESPNRIDPWWWPFWSENPPAEASAQPETERSKVEMAANEIAPQSSENLTEKENAVDTTNTTKVQQPKKANWNWPF